MGCGVDPVRVFAYHEYGVPELALRDSGVDRGTVLWMDMAKNRIDLCVGDCACGGGCALALPVSDAVKRWSALPPPFLRKNVILSGLGKQMVQGSDSEAVT